MRGALVEVRLARTPDELENCLRLRWTVFVEALARHHVEPMEMGGRSRRGWIYVAPEALDEAGALEDWVERGVSYASSLPPK